MPAIFPRPFVLLLMGALFATVADFHQTRGFAQDADGPTMNSLSPTDDDQETVDKATGDKDADETPDQDSPDQDSPEQDSPEQDKLEIPAEVIEKGKKLKNQFLDTRKELAQALIDMRITHTRFANDEDRSPEAKRRYGEQRTKARRLMNKLFDEGLEVISWVPDKEAATYLVTMIQHRIERDFYDAKTMEAGARMIDQFNSNTIYVFKATARSAVVSGDFDLAKRVYDVLEQEQLDDIDKGFIFNADVLEEQYKEEMEARKIDEEKDTNPRVRIVTTRGDLVIELFLDQAPSAVSNFIGLVEENFYDKLDFHQVVKGLLALTGDVSVNGTGNTGKFLIDECNREDARMPLARSLVMAKLPIGNTGEFIKDSASCQFAILYAPISKILGQQTVFGRVIEGMDSICELRRVDPSKKKKKGEILIPPDRIISMEVIRRPDNLPEPKYVDLREMAAHAAHNHAPGEHPAGQ